MLAFEVEFLTGVSVAATPYRREEAEWPPHPDRFFQSLVAAWGRNERPYEDERKALEWLEGLDMNTLEISAPAGGLRESGTVYVPPNDFLTPNREPAAMGWVKKMLAGEKLTDNEKKERNRLLSVVPSMRGLSLKPRSFPAVTLPLGVPTNITYVWHLDEDGKNELETHRAPLARLVREVTYLGHSQALVRVALKDGEEVSIDESWKSVVPAVMRLPYRNRLRELEELYQRSMEQKRIFRPNPSLVTRVFRGSDASTVPETYFDADSVVIFTDAGGFVPTLAAFPLVAKRLRDTLLACAPSDEPIPSLLSGHDAEGRPTGEPHMAIVPLADVGWNYSQGRLMGLALVWPRTASTSDRVMALKSVVSFLQDRQGRFGLLHFGRDGSWSLALESTPGPASLRFDRYARTARRWGTVLPVALDRHPKSKPGEELADIIARACLNIGLPVDAVNGIQIETHKYAPVKGAPSVREVLQSMPVDSPYSGKPFVHLVLNFAKPVRGPLILGAGRFRGLGLCLPLDGESAS